jgi:hypothetical protein
MTYDELMALYMDPRQMAGAGALGAPIYASTGEGGGSYIAGYENAAGQRDPYFNLPDGRNVFFDSSNGQFTVAQGTNDANGGIQRWQVSPGGVQDLGFERERSFGDLVQNAASNAAPYLAGMAGLGLGAAYLPGLLGGGAAGAGGMTLEAALAGLPSTGGGMALGDAVAALGGGGAAAGVGGAAAGGGGLLGSLGSAGSALSGIGSGVSGLLGGSGLGALGAAGLGALAGVAGNGDISSTQSTTGNTSASGTSSQSLAPWLQGYAQDYVGRAQQLANGPTTNANLDTAGGLLSQYATQGDPLVNQARAQQANVIGGGMLGKNPYLDSVADNIGRRMGDAYATGTRAGVFSGYNNDGNSVLAKSGFGQTLGMQDRNYADALGSTMSNLYANNYNTERAAQDNASRGSLNFGQFGTNNAQALAGFGADQFQRPFMANQQFGQAINPSFGSTASNSTTGMTNNTQTQNVQAPSNFLSGLGGAAAGAGIWQNIFGGRR